GDKDLELKPSQAVLRRGDKQVVVVTRLNKPAGAANTFAEPDPKWVKMVQALTAQKQLEEVKQEIKRRNPDFVGELIANLSPKGAVITLKLPTGEVTDLTPLRVFKELEELECLGNRVGTYAPLEDLRPLAGLKLKRLNLARNSVSDLRPLKGMPLEFL